MRRPFIALTLLTLSCSHTPSLPTPPMITPDPRTDRNSQLAHQDLLAKTRQGRIDVYFLGDSITRRWGCGDPQYAHLLANWTQNFHGYNAANFGWGGDTTRNILWRITNGELDHVQPKVIVLLAGTNDLPPRLNDHPDTVAADVTAGLHAILHTCRTKCPSATILLTAIFPRTDHPNYAPIIQRINQNLSTLAATDPKHIRFVNINDHLLTPEGRLRPTYFNPDNLHPALPTYQAWATALKPHLHDLLGPPAPTDHAPPPTSDPSLSKR